MTDSIDEKQPHRQRSTGEVRVEVILECLGYVKDEDFFINYTFPKELMGNEVYKYDFYIPNKRLVIEVDGSQHFEYTRWFHHTKKDFDEYRKTDILKTIIAIYSCNLRILRISYDKKSKNSTLWSTRTLSRVLQEVVSQDKSHISLYITHRRLYTCMLMNISQAIIDLKLIKDDEYLHGHEHEIIKGSHIEAIPVRNGESLIRFMEFPIPIYPTYERSESVKALTERVMTGVITKPSNVTVPK
jgi:very-short-patch-repair endonuclease